jgi:predicted 2-oxoglutarate/Fe(II)-dependent dioxygenase YbiX
MSKRLQAILGEALREIQRMARAKHITVVEWLRQALRAARRRKLARETDKKIAVIRAAMGHAFPSGDIEHVLSEIERGYLRETRR